MPKPEGENLEGSTSTSLNGDRKGSIKVEDNEDKKDGKALLISTES